MAETHHFFATTAKGMEPLLSEEIRKLGAQQVEEVRAGVSFRGPLSLGYRACLWSRVANRILLPLKTFSAPNPAKLYGGMKSVRWSDHLTPKETLAVDFSSSRSAITHTHFGALKAKDAIVDQLRSVHGTRPSVDLVRPDIRVNVYVHEDQATVSLDLSGDSLHQRGYREEGTPAPLKENLAAAILLTAGWPQAAQEGRCFLDAMCGSGTLPIEAALIAANIAPGINRTHFGFLRWKAHDPKVWTEVREEALDLQVRDRKKLPPIVGTDRDARAVRIAIANARKAGVEDLVHIEKKEFGECSPLPSRAKEIKGIIVLNPPYGERLGEEEELRGLYKQIGDCFKRRFPGWQGFVFTGNPELAKCIGLKASRRFVLFNGAIECRLLKFDLY